MDKIKNALSGATGSSSTSSSSTAQPAGQKDDYGDKIANAIDAKTGNHVGHDKMEKLTDSARGLYEKQTGKPVNPKFSN